MVDPHANGCPEPEVLAAYVDRGLSLSERARVERHLALCPQCVALVAGAARTVAELSAQAPDEGVLVEATPRAPRRSLAGALAAAAAVIAVVAAPSVMRPWLERDSGLVSLADSVGEQRSVLGRLTGGFPHAPLDGPSAGGQDGRPAGTDRVQFVAGKIRESFGERITPSQLHALGVAQLLAGDLDEAAQSLLAASREQPNNARYLSDVAAVQLERARLQLKADDLPRALAAAERATRLDPSLREAWFNRALAASALSLREHARSSWTEYLARDGGSAWSAEARSRLAELTKPTAADAWSTAAAGLDQSIDPGAAEAAVRTHVSESRGYLEHLLGQWAANAVSGRDASSALERVRVMADAFARVTGDGLYRDTVTAIDQAAAGGGAHALALSHQQFAAASELFNEDRFADAAPGLSSARDGLRAAKSPFAIRPSLDLATVDYVRSRYTEATAAIDAAAAAARSRGYTGAMARAHWIGGLIAFAQGRMGDAQARYEETLGEFDRMGDAEQAATIHNNLATLFFYLGDEQRAWEHHPAALRGLEISRSPRRRHPILLSAATSARFSNPVAALAIQEETVRNAQAWGRPEAVAEALALRATLRADAGQAEAARADLDAARGQLALSAEPAFRERVEVTVLTTESDLLRTSNPAAAVAAATRAIAILEARGDRSRLAPLQLRLAKANIVWGRTEAAQQALAKGIKAFDDERAAISNEARALVTDASWDLFTTSVQLAINKGDLDTAFSMAERSRTRSVAESKRLPATRSLRDVQASLSSDETIVALNQFDDELAVWIIRASGSKVFVRPVTRVDAERLVARQQDEVWRESDRLTASRDLYNEIMRPARAALSGAKHIVFVADRTYENAAFAGLWNASTRRFLAEDAVVTMASSANALVTARRADRPVANDVLVFGGAAPRALEEAQAIANVARGGSMVTGEAATRSRLLTDVAAHAIVHLAMPFGSSGQNPLLSRLQVADEPGARHSGIVRGSEIAAQTLSRTRLVVMDEVARDDTYRGEGTSSMARAFLAAGVPAVLGTLPGADERATRDLMIAFHREVAAGASAAQALSTVQRNAIQQNGRRLGAWSALVMYGSDR